mmetsp:Transcript_21114/g.29601  ORF Transcript_21114/g.29601 Transcript_21114/m.29601 type:complete len:230 (+) Transcript_21114:44-733(+)
MSHCDHLPKILEPTNPVSAMAGSVCSMQNAVVSLPPLISLCSMPPLQRDPYNFNPPSLNISLASSFSTKFPIFHKDANVTTTTNSNLIPLRDVTYHQSSTFHRSAEVPSPPTRPNLTNMYGPSFKNYAQTIPESQGLQIRKPTNLGKKYNKRMTQEMRKFLENWLWEHLDNPKFTESEKKELFDKGLTQKQLTNWMNYAKKRRVQVMKSAKHYGQQYNSSASPSSTDGE